MTNVWKSSLLALAACLAAALPVAASQRSLAPVLAAPAWVNGRATAATTAGRVTLVDVFTFDCINCKHVVPELRRLHARYAPGDLAIVGVHTPETPYERERDHIVTNLRAQGITWPVALDPENAIWNALGNEYWPTQYVFDRHGALRATFVGEGNDAEVDATVAKLVAERT